MQPIERGYLAQAVLENSVFRDAMNELDNEYHAAWHDAKTVEAREDCHRYVTIIKKFEQHLKSVMTTGKIAERDRDELEGKRKKLWPIAS